MLDGRGGVCCEDCDVAPAALEGVEGGVASWAIDPDDARRLWEYSADAAGVDAFG